MINLATGWVATIILLATLKEYDINAGVSYNSMIFIIIIFIVIFGSKLFWSEQFIYDYHFDIYCRPGDELSEPAMAIKYGFHVVFQACWAEIDVAWNGMRNKRFLHH